jgi:hypothetical protein
MNTIRRIHLNPQSKGNLGKSFEAEFRAAWLDRLGVPWNGSDLDDRHHTFANRHPEIVRSYQLGNEQESKAELLSLFRRVLKDAAPVHIIDTRAQADALILTALEELQVLDICAEQGDCRVAWIFTPRRRGQTGVVHGPQRAGVALDRRAHGAPPARVRGSGTRRWPHLGIGRGLPSGHSVCGTCRVFAWAAVWPIR